MLFEKLGSAVSLRAKLLFIGIVLPTLMVGTLLFLYSNEAHDKAVSAGVDKARSICLAAESARNESEKQWASGIFETKTLTKWAEQGENEKVLSTIPVVLAWNAAMSKCKEGGYEFQVPAMNPRNPDNEPTDFQREILEKLKAETLDEYHIVNEETNSVHYFRPVRLSESCLACHGDPETSLALWGNSDGIDATGYKMENWKLGQMHGAFEIIQSLDDSKADAQASVFYAIVFSVVALAVSGVITFLTTRTITNKICTAISSIRNYVGNLRTFSENLGVQSSENSSQANVMRSSVETVNENITSVSSAVDEMGEAINEISHRSSDVSEVAGNAVTETEIAKSAMSRLEKSCRKIDDVVTLINGLSEQTNLLALNATIEAARAGEAGKGFAVVANEVKELANQTGKATGGISEVISSIHADTNEVIGSVDKICETIGEISSAQQAIAAAVTEQSATTQAIISNLSDVSGLSNDITDRIRTVAESTSETSRQAEQSSELVGEIESTANEFPSLVGVPYNIEN